jgi:hypothetical protein
VQDQTWVEQRAGAGAHARVLPCTCAAGASGTALAVCADSTAAACAAPGIYYYSSEVTNNTYILNQFVSNFTKAQEFCTDNGGHLAAFSSLEEQQEVEGYYIEMGYLLPTYHKSYYIGTRRPAPRVAGRRIWPAFCCYPGRPGPMADSAHRPKTAGAYQRTRPDWIWLNPLVTWNETSYKHWGVYSVDGSAEPNNKDPPEDCAVANYTEAYDNVFGWADTNCANKFIFMCKLIRGWPLVPSCLGALALPRSSQAARAQQTARADPPGRLCAAAAEGALMPPPTTADGGTDFVLKLNRVSYDEAEDCCNQLCGHLAAYTSQEEQLQVGPAWPLVLWLGGPPPLVACARPQPLTRAKLLPLQVESFYINGGYLLPGFHRHYWMGAVATDWPKFAWTDVSIPPLDKSYKHWGTMVRCGAAGPFRLAGTCAAGSVAWQKGSKQWGVVLSFAVLLQVPSGVKEPFQAEPPEFCTVANYTETYGRPNVWGWSDTNCGNKFFPMCRINSEWPCRAASAKPGTFAQASVGSAGDSFSSSTCFLGRAQRADPCPPTPT